MTRTSSAGTRATWPRLIPCLTCVVRSSNSASRSGETSSSLSTSYLSLTKCKLTYVDRCFTCQNECNPVAAGLVFYHTNLYIMQTVYMFLWSSSVSDRKNCEFFFSWVKEFLKEKKQKILIPTGISARCNMELLRWYWTENGINVSGGLISVGITKMRELEILVSL